jgi:hypothetical protein
MITSPLEDTGASAAQRTADVDFLRSEGIRPHPGQVADSKTASFYYDELRDGRYKDIRDAFTRAAMRQAGVDGLATTGQRGNIPRIMDEASQRYQTAIARAGSHIGADQQLLQELVARVNEVARPGLYEESTINAVNGAAQRVAEMAVANANRLPTREYQTLRSDLATQARETQDPRLKRLMYGLVTTIDDTAARHLANIGENPQQFRDAADYYKRMLTLKEAADSAGAATAAGHITPSNLQRAAESVYGTDSRLREDNPFARLARAGVNVLGEARSSGTAERAGVKAMIALPGGIAAMMGAGHLWDAAGMGGEHLSGLGGLLGLEGGAAAAGAALSKPVLRAVTDNPVARRYIGNQLAQDLNGGPLAAGGYVPGLLTAMQATQPTKHEPLRVTVHPREGYYAGGGYADGR